MRVPVLVLASLLGSCVHSHGHRTGADAIPPPSCTRGQAVTADTAGNCCWQGQAWSGTTCVGLPLACPEGLRVDSLLDACVVWPCPMEQDPVDGLHCCWPGQTWSTEGERCEGRPSACPEDREPSPEGCVRKGEPPHPPASQPGTGPAPAPVEGSCPEGQHLAVDGAHCCPAGQGWSTPRQACVGPSVVSGARPGEGPILGALDKTAIDETMRANVDLIRDCYEQALTANPRLRGKLVVKFAILKDGTVSTAATKSSTLNHPQVEDCINQEVMRFQFPTPKGGGMVIVSYPFVFEPG